MAQTPARLIVVDDDAEIRRLLADRLSDEGFQVATAVSGEDFLAQFDPATTDLVVLDINLPGVDGLGVCERLREANDTPIIMLTARGDPRDRIAGLELGADDYIAKPFEPRELVARIRNVLRRSGPNTDSARFIRFRQWTLDVVLRRVVDDTNRAVILSATEFRILRLLIDRAGSALSREEILELGGSVGEHSGERAVDLQVSRLRTKLRDNHVPHTIIETVRRQGYSFVAPIQCS